MKKDYNSWSKDKIEDRLATLKQELIMRNYYDGWTVKGINDEINELNKLL